MSHVYLGHDLSLSLSESLWISLPWTSFLGHNYKIWKDTPTHIWEKRHDKHYLVKAFLVFLGISKKQKTKNTPFFSKLEVPGYDGKTFQGHDRVCRTLKCIKIPKETPTGIYWYTNWTLVSKLHCTQTLNATNYTCIQLRHLLPLMFWTQHTYSWKPKSKRNIWKKKTIHCDTSSFTLQCTFHKGKTFIKKDIHQSSE